MASIEAGSAAAAALTAVDAPVVVAVVAAGVAAFGVGDYLHNLIDTYGDQQLAIAQTDGDIRQMGKDLGHLAERAWGKIESQWGF